MTEIPQKKKRKLFRQLKHTYRLVFFNDSTFEEVWHLRFTLMNVLSLAGTLFILLVGGSMALVMYTPIRELVPGYPTEAMRRELVTNIMRMDSLEYEIQLRDKYFNMLNAIIAGREPEITDTQMDNLGNDYRNITFSRSVQDSLLRQEVEAEERFNYTASSVPVIESSISKMHFFKPLAGIVVNEFDANSGHFGVDVVAPPSEVVKSVLDGTVIMATWTLDTGYVIEIQHGANILSIYKHNSNLLKKAGDKVNAGDAIAIVGNSGELTTGPHLHLEIWQNGKPIDPKDYIVF